MKVSSYQLLYGWASGRAFAVTPRHESFLKDGATKSGEHATGNHSVMSGAIFLVSDSVCPTKAGRLAERSILPGVGLSTLCLEVMPSELAWTKSS